MSKPSWRDQVGAVGWSRSQNVTLLTPVPTSVAAAVTVVGALMTAPAAGESIAPVGFVLSTMIVTPRLVARPALSTASAASVTEPVRPMEFQLKE